MHSICVGGRINNQFLDYDEEIAQIGDSVYVWYETAVGWVWLSSKYVQFISAFDRHDKQIEIIDQIIETCRMIDKWFRPAQ